MDTTPEHDLDIAAPLPPDTIVAVVIPALNEQRAIGLVLKEIPTWIHRVIVADNGSTDDTPAVAQNHGALVVRAARRGYGSACLAGIAAVGAATIIVFMDGDYSDHPRQMTRLLNPILQDQADMVIGSRILGRPQRGALTPQQRFGGFLACTLMRWLWGVNYTDLGPFRAIRAGSLQQLKMDDADFGWTVQMQIRAAVAGLRIREVPVDYRPRIGKSKISGTIRGVLHAGIKILYTIARERLSQTRYQR